MKTHRAVLRGTMFVLGVALAALPGFAQDEATPSSYRSTESAAAASADDQPAVAPARGATYARLREFEGGISLKREDENASQDVELAINSPLIPGDQIWTGEDGRLEVQLADGTLLRLDHNSRLSFLNLADRAGSFDDTTLLRLLNGSLYVRADNFDAHSRRFQIDTPAGSIFLLSGGVFRLDVGVDGVSTVASYRGVAEILGDDISVMAHSGERATAEPGRRPSDARAFNTLHRDPFDEWAEGRDDSYASNDSRRGPRPQVPDQIAPYAGELSRYGTWRDDPSYGWTWQPANVANDWRPYYYGSWNNAPIGVSWVSSEPWGWAPYHYGRWQWGLGVGWFWVPGVVYSGAYVSWSVGPSFYGWCPLGYYNSPVVVAGGGFGYVYVPHTYIFSVGVHRHAYSYSDVSRYRLEQNSVALRGAPSWKHGAHPEISGSANYRRAITDARVAPSRPQVGPAAGGGRVPFTAGDQGAYRRAILERQAAIGKNRNATIGGAAGVRSIDARPVGFNKGGASSYRTSPAFQRSSRPSSVKPDEPVSTATGRPVRQPVRMLPETGRRTSAVSPRPAGEREISSATADNPQMGRSAGRRGQSGFVPSPQASPRPNNAPSQNATAPHPRADAGRRTSGGPFVMPTHPPSVSAPRPGGDHTPVHPTPRPQAAEKGKGGGHRK